MGKTPVFIGIGSNLSDPVGQCQTALEHLKQLPDTDYIACSSFYKTSPLEAPGLKTNEMPQFINAVCRLNTGLSPQSLIDHLQRIEKEMGRVRREKWGSRVIDLDLLFYGESIFKTDSITVPHPELHNRSFTLLPLVEIAKDWTHPALRKTVAELWESLDAATRSSIRKSLPK